MSTASFADSLLNGLVRGLVKPELDPPPPVAESLLPTADPLSDWAWGALVVCALVGIVVGVVLWRRRSRTLLNWPFLVQHLAHQNHLDEALHEFRTLELLVGLKIPQVRETASAWNELSQAEQAVALGVLQNRATTDLAQELACTVSHIYNLRASIRKKWNLDNDIPLNAALAQAQAEGRI